jgi:hypothetical protein
MDLIAGWGKRWPMRSRSLGPVEHTTMGGRQGPRPTAPSRGGRHKQITAKGGVKRHRCWINREVDGFVMKERVESDKGGYSPRNSPPGQSMEERGRWAQTRACNPRAPCRRHPHQGGLSLTAKATLGACPRLEVGLRIATISGRVIGSRYRPLAVAQNDGFCAQGFLFWTFDLHLAPWIYRTHHKLSRTGHRVAGAYLHPALSRIVTSKRAKLARFKANKHYFSPRCDSAGTTPLP